MEIKNLGNNSVSIATNSTNVLLNPTEKELKSVEPDIVLITKDSIDVKPDDTKAYVIIYPGEYEMKEVFIDGITTLKDKRNPDIYMLGAEDVNVVYIEGSVKEIDKDTLELLGVVHVLIIASNGDNNTLNFSAITNKIDPHIVIPLGLNETEIADLMKSIGAKEIEKETKLKVKSEDFSDEEELPVRLVCLE